MYWWQRAWVRSSYWCSGSKDYGWLRRSCFHSTILAGREATLIKCHIPGQFDSVGLVIPELIAFRARLKPNKHSHKGFLIQLVTLVSRYMHVGFAAKYTQICNVRNCTIIPDCIWSPPLQDTGGSVVIYVHCRFNYKFPKAVRQASSMLHS